MILNKLKSLKETDMIVLGEKRENLNIIHLIMGPETEFQFDMSGQCIIDITEHQKHTEPDGHTILVINRCESEEMLAEKLKELHKENPEEITENSEKTKEKTKENNSNEQTNFKCPLCFEDNKGILKNGLIIPCKTCQKINEGIIKHNVPEAPSNDQLKSIVADMIKKTPKEFKLLCEKISKDNKRKPKTNAS